MQYMRSLFALAAGTFAACAPVQVSAQAVIGGTTDVTLTAAPTLAGLGLSASPTGTATVTVAMGIPTFTFPITGGSINGTDALLYHDGSGILFTGGMNTLQIGNFVVDTANALVTGDATANGSLLGSVPLFELDSGANLFLTAEAAGAFTTVFGAPNLTGANIGFATPNPVTTAVPEPGTWAMMLAGFGLCGLAIRRSLRRRTSPAIACRYRAAARATARRLPSEPSA